MPPNLNINFRMKKLILFAAVLALGVTSCSKDDDNNNNQAELAGKWEFSHEGAVLMGQEFLMPYTHTTGCAKDFIVITPSTIVEHNFNGSNCQESTSTDAYTISGNTITRTNDGEVIVEEVVLLDNSTLKVISTQVMEGMTVGEVTVYTRK